MKANDIVEKARGFVSPRFVDLSTGKTMEFSSRHNTLSYMSAEAMAAAFGGNPSYIPSKVGFIYGTNDVSFNEDIGRDQSWASLENELSADGMGAVDVQVVDFSFDPTLGPGEEDSSSSGSDDDYCNIKPGGSNAVTFHAASNSSDVGVIKGNSVFVKDCYIFQALLLSPMPYTSGYYILARVSLKDYGVTPARYLQKPEGFEVALDWTVVFK